MSGKHEHQKQRASNNTRANALHSTRISWELIPDTVLKEIRGALLWYRFVFSTNYDLLIYWAVMNHEPTDPKDLSGKKPTINDFKDFFFQAEEHSTVFDITNTGITSTATRVLYLHGALHLFHR